MPNKIYYGKNVYDKKEINAVIKRIKDTTQMGPSVAEFEKKVSKIFSKKYGLMVNSGSSALILALKVLNFDKDSEIITPCLNFGTAVSSIMLSNYKPVFVDCEVDTLQINISQIKNKITKKTRALLIPNLIGNIPDWKEIKKIAKKNKLLVIEDSADTIGCKINKKATSIYSDISITSFYGSHVISCAGNGGMMLTNNSKYFQKAKILRSWGRMSTLVKDSDNINKRLGVKLKGYDYDKKFIFSEVGYNFEPSELGAAFGLEQLKKLKNFTIIRNRNFDQLYKFFKTLNKFFILPKIHKGVFTNFLAYPIILKENRLFNRKQMQIFMEKNNIQTRPIFSGNILRHPAFNKLVNVKNKLNSFKNSDYIMKNGLLIGCHQGLNENQISKIKNVIKKFLKEVKA